MAKTYALIPAAGLGQRMGQKKQFMLLLGKPLFIYALEAFGRCSRINGVVLIVPPADEKPAGEMISQYLPGLQPKVVAGGQTRQDSVFQGLMALDNDVSMVVIHDGARPLLNCRDLDSLLASADRYGAATLAVPVKETVKLGDPSGFVERTLPRERLWQVQTPQAFRRDWLVAAHQRARQEGICAYDDASLLEWDNKPVKLVAGSYDNIKVTTPEDLLLAEVLIGGKR